MGSLGSDGEDELQPVTSVTKKQKFSRKFLDDSASVPRKMRSAMMKRGREPIIPPLPVSGKLKASNGGHSRAGDRSKKSKLKKKVDNVSKDEEEAAKTLYAFASIVKDSTKSTMSSGLESAGKDGESSTTQEASKQSSTSFTVEAASCSSNLMESTVQHGKFNSSGDGKQSNLPISKPSSSTGANGVRLESSPVQMQKMPTLDATPSGIQKGKGKQPLTCSDNENEDLLLPPRSSPAVAPSSQTQASLPQPNMPNLDATPSRIQIGTQLAFDENKNNDLPLCPRSFPTLTPSSQTQAAFPQSSTAQQTTSSDQPHYLYRPRPYEKNVINNRLTGPRRSTKSWKNCATHIHMCRLIEASKRAEKNGGSQVMNLGPRLSENRQTNASFNNNITHIAAEKRQVEMPNLQYQRLLRDQQRLVSIASSSSNSHKRGSEFLSLAARGNIPMQSQSPPAMLSSLPRNCYLSNFAGNPSNAAANQMYLSGMSGGPSNVDATAAKRLRLELDEQQKRMAQISSSQYHPGFNSPRLAIGQNGGRDSSSPLNYAQLISQQFQSSLNSKNKGIMPPHQQILAGNSSGVRRQLLPSDLGRNGAVFDPKSLQFQLLCNQQR